MKVSELKHYGTKEHSGRYPWGSGENPYQRLGNGSINARIKDLTDSGMSIKEIEEGMGMTANERRKLESIEKMEAVTQRYYRIQELHKAGYSNVKIANMLGVTEGTVRNSLKEDFTKKNKSFELKNVCDNLKKEMDKKDYLDIGKGAEYALRCSETRKDTAVKYLQEKYGYELHTIYVDQLGTNHKTTMSILCKPGTEKSFLYDHLDKIHGIDESRVIREDGTVKLGMEKPIQIKRDRIKVVYDEEGGSDKDGVIELRRGVDDISLGNANYAQVRIAVEGNQYMKGMAIYRDDMPPGVDIIYNSNKAKGSPDDKVFKPMKDDQDNPFGATIKGLNDKNLPDEEKELKLTQRYYTDKDGKEKLSAINVVNEEGTWEGWSRTLSSQFLSKQTVQLAKRQLDIAQKESVSDLEDIMNLTEPTVKKSLLLDYADKCDAAAAQLKAAALPRQSTCVILPVPSLKENEVYAPQYKTGEHVCLVRHPHGGVFEIPELVVNNNHKEGKSVVGTATDAIGINIQTAQQLSGADFDGDSVLVLPSDNVHIKTKKGLPGLKDFDTKVYKLPDDAPKISSRTKNHEMGKITNLIADMTIMGADDEELLRAVKHSMVVIDSEKHHLDYKKSYKDNNIAQLKLKYRGSTTGGAATIVTQAKSEYHVPERKDYYDIDPKTGKKIYKLTGKAIRDPKTGKVVGYEPRTYEETKKTKNEAGEVVYEKTGKINIATTKINKMDAVDDAYELTSDKRGGRPMETVYANYANQMKALANRARKESLSVVDREFSPSAANTYAKEVDSLETKLLIALKNKPRERQAQLLANSKLKAQIAANPERKDDNDWLKKQRGQALSSARAAVGAKKEYITFTDREWEAIQSGAIKKGKLQDIIDNANSDEVKRRSMPKTTSTLSSAKVATIKALIAGGHTQAEVAERLGISVTTVSRAMH